MKKIDEKGTLADVIKGINEIIEHLENLPAPRDRGPKSQRDMTKEDATCILIGKLKDASHRKAAEVLGLSYGQIYSARNGYTFRGIFEESKKKK